MEDTLSEDIEHYFMTRHAGQPGGYCLMTEGCGCGCNGAPKAEGGCGGGGDYDDQGPDDDDGGARMRLVRGRKGKKNKVKIAFGEDVGELLRDWNEPNNPYYRALMKLFNVYNFAEIESVDDDGEWTDEDDLAETSWSRREGDRKRGKGAANNPFDRTPGGTSRARRHLKKRGHRRGGDVLGRRAGRRERDQGNDHEMDEADLDETSWSRREGDRKRGKGAGGNPAPYADHTPGGTARSRKHIKKRGQKFFGKPKGRRGGVDDGEFEESEESQFKKVSGKLYGATQGLKEALAAAKGTPFADDISSLMTKVQEVKGKVDGAENRAWASAQHDEEYGDWRDEVLSAHTEGDEGEHGEHKPRSRAKNRRMHRQASGGRS